MVARIAHGQHTLVDILEPLGQQEIFDEVALHLGVAREVERHASREVAVAQPSRAFARRGVHEYVERALAVRFAGRIEESVEFGVVRREGSAPYVGVAVVAHVHALDGALAALHHRLGELHGVGLEALQIVLARRQFIYHVGLTTQTFDVHVSVGSQELVERHAQQRRLLDLDAHAQKSAAVALELVYSASLLHGVVHSVIGICHAARQQSLRGLLGERDGLDRLPIDLPGPVVERRIESVTLGERALYAEARHVGPALLQIVRGEFAARGRHDLAADLHLGLQERRLVEQIVVRLVVASMATTLRPRRRQPLKS